MDCLFCKIAQKESASEIILEDDEIIIFKNIYPKAEIHFLIVSKKHIESIDSLEESDINLMGKLIFTAKKVADKLNLKNKYKLVFNVGREGGQLINHIHLHFLSGKKIEMP